MENREKLLSNVKLNLKGILNSTTSSILVRDIQKEYEELTCNRLPYRDLGFKTLEELFRSMPEVVRIERSYRGDVLVMADGPSSSNHIHILVKEQKAAKRNGKSNIGYGRQSNNRSHWVPPKPMPNKFVNRSGYGQVSQPVALKTSKPPLLPNPPQNLYQSTNFNTWQPKPYPSTNLDAPQPKPYLSTNLNSPQPNGFQYPQFHPVPRQKSSNMVELQKIIQKVIDSNPYGLPFHQLKQECNRLLKGSWDSSNLSFNGWHNMMAAMKSIVRLEQSPTGLIIFPAKKDLAGEEILRLVNGNGPDLNQKGNFGRQVNQTARNQQVENGEVINHNNNCELEGSDHYGQLSTISEESRSKPSSRISSFVPSESVKDLDDSNSVVDSYVEGSIISEASTSDKIFKENLHQVMVNFKDGLPIYEVPTEYEKHTGKKLRFGRYGDFRDIYDLINCHNDVLKCDYINIRDVKVYPASHPLPKAADKQKQVKKKEHDEIVPEDTLLKMLEVVNNQSSGVHIKVFEMVYENRYGESFKVDDQTCGSSLEAIFTKLAKYFNLYYVGKNGNILIKCTVFGKDWLRQHLKPLSPPPVKILPYVIEIPDDAVTNCDALVVEPNNGVFVVGQIYPVVVSALTSPNKFSFQLDEQVEQLDEFNTEMTTLYEDEVLSTRYTIDMTKVRVGLPCAGYYEDAHVWNRVWITAVNDRGMVDVNFYDYGNFGSIHLSRLRFLRKAFLNVPSFCHRAKLANIEGTIEGRWEVSARRLFTELTLNKALEAKVVKTGSPLYIELYEDAQNVGDVLVRNGKAKRISDPNIGAVNISTIPRLVSTISSNDGKRSASPRCGKLSNGSVSPSGSDTLKFGKDVLYCSSSYEDIDEKITNLSISSDSDDSHIKTKTRNGSFELKMRVPTTAGNAHVVHLDGVHYIPTAEISRYFAKVDVLQEMVRALHATAKFVKIYRHEEILLFNEIFTDPGEAIPAFINLIRISDLPELLPRILTDVNVIEEITSIAEFFI